MQAGKDKPAPTDQPDLPSAVYQRRQVLEGDGVLHAEPGLPIILNSSKAAH